MHTHRQRSPGTATVLTNAKGFTLYSFAPDTMTTSKCNHSCAQIWPPATGPATAGFGVTGMLGGRWHEVTPSGAAAPAPTSSGGGNGY